jgi:hypothetical protein
MPVEGGPVIVYFPLGVARLCLSCGVVTNATRCPTCGGTELYLIARWLDRERERA